MTFKNKHLVVIAGPTASGKTGTAIRVAAHFNSEIISADSRQIYREMRIGTAVPDNKQLSAVRHHFIHSLSLDTYYNASMFENDVLILLEELFRKHDIVVMAGGSGLYIDAVCKGIDDLPTVDPSIRKRLAARYENEGLEPLQKELQQLDPESYVRVDLNNHMRVLKALEISLQTGKPYSAFLTRKDKQRGFNIIRIALHVDREKLYRRINKRVDEMIEAGLVDEVKQLLPFRNATAMKTVGYREILGYLDGAYGLDEAVEKIRNNTRTYARKQITWFRKNNSYTWMDPADPEVIIRHIENEVMHSGD